MSRRTLPTVPLWASLPAALATCVALAAPLAAQTTVDATDPDAVLAIAKGYGTAELELDAQGDPMVSGRMDGTLYTVLFYGCTENRNCTDIQFSASFTPSRIHSLTEINGWNRDRRFSKIFINDEGTIFIQHDVNTRHGVTTLNLDDSFDWFKLSLSSFRKDFLDK